MFVTDTNGYIWTTNCTGAINEKFINSLSNSLHSFSGLSLLFSIFPFTIIPLQIGTRASTIQPRKPGETQISTYHG